MKIIKQGKRYNDQYPSKVSELAEVWDGGDGNGFVLLDGVHYRVDEPVGTKGQFYAILGDQYAQRDVEYEKSLREVQLLELVPELLAALQIAEYEMPHDKECSYRTKRSTESICDCVRGKITHAIMKATLITKH